MLLSKFKIHLDFNFIKNLKVHNKTNKYKIINLFVLCQISSEDYKKDKIIGKENED